MTSFTLIKPTSSANSIMCKVVFQVAMVFGVILLCVAAYGTYLPSDTCNVWCKSLTWAGFVVMAWTCLYFGFSAIPRENIIGCCDGKATCECDGRGPQVSHAYTAGEIVDILCLPCTVTKIVGSILFCWPCKLYDWEQEKWKRADALTNAQKDLDAARQQIAALTKAVQNQTGWAIVGTAPSAPPEVSSVSGDPKV